MAFIPVLITTDHVATKALDNPLHPVALLHKVDNLAVEALRLLLRSVEVTPLLVDAAVQLQLCAAAQCQLDLLLQLRDLAVLAVPSLRVPMQLISFRAC